MGKELAETAAARRLPSEVSSVEETPQAQQSTPSENPDRKIIHVSDEFRRAKRNALAWAAFTVLLALAFDNGGAAELTGFVRNLSFSQNTLLLLALLALCFAAVGYWRAERNLITRNSYIEYGNTLMEAAGGVRDLIAQLEENHRIALGSKRAIQENVKDMQRALLKHKDSLLGEAKNLKTQVSHVEKQLSVAADNATKVDLSLEPSGEGMRLKDEDGAYGKVVGSAASLRSLSEEFTKWADTIDKQPSRILLLQEELENIDLERPFADSKDLAEYRYPELEALEAKLTGMSNEIDRTERRLFRWHDRFAVYLSVVTGIVLALMRLLFDQPMQWALVHLGLA